ncbi:MAG: hypothetical protein FWF96_00650 [Kiritimatiellaeota bacterium]|nr:hypothetical protein [Kiritimatiellota bacterium]
MKQEKIEKKKVGNDLLTVFALAGVPTIANMFMETHLDSFAWVGYLAGWGLIGGLSYLGLWGLVKFFSDKEPETTIVKKLSKRKKIENKTLVNQELKNWLKK